MMHRHTRLAASDGSTRYRFDRAPRAWTLVLVLVSAPVVATPSIAALEPLDIRHERWSGYRATETLPDGSTLVEYGGETEALSSPGLRLRVGFVPRFACAALVGVIADAPTSGVLGLNDTDGVVELDVRIDGERIELPLLVEADDARSVYFHAEVDALNALREQIDSADVASFRPAEGQPVLFSLFGSQRTLAATETRCRVHEPEPEAEAPSNAGANSRGAAESEPASAPDGGAEPDASD